MVNLCCSFAEGGHSGRPTDDLIDARAGDRLQQALHEPRHQHHDQETREAEARSVLVHGAALLPDLDLHRLLLSRRQSRPLPRQPVQSLQRGLAAGRWIGRRWALVHQRLHHDE